MIPHSDANFENKEIKGITPKAIWWILVNTVVVVSTVLFSVNGIKNSIYDLKTQLIIMQTVRDNDRKYYDLKIDDLTDKVNKLEGRVDGIENKVNQLEDKSLFK